MRKLLFALAFAAAATLVGTINIKAQNYPPPKEGDWLARDFRFHTGEVLSELRIHYTIVGEPSGEPVLILHRTTQSGTGMLSPAFAGEPFGPGQPLDANKYFIILPDSIGHGKARAWLNLLWL
jgi:homoserine O-acetyltransferase/O-succinyltransferase